MANHGRMHFAFPLAHQDRDSDEECEETSRFMRALPGEFPSSSWHEMR